MFAFAVWDAAEQRLILARDRFGKKPLYYCASGNALVFASEIKGVLAHPEVSRDLDPAAIPAYLTFGYVPTPRTFFAGIQSLPPGHVLTVDAGAPPRLERYWTPARRRAPGPVVLRLRLRKPGPSYAVFSPKRWRGAWSRTCRSARCLSGGVDSSAVVATMARLNPGRVSTFTIGFDGADGYDERPFAEMVARRYGTDHHEFVVRPNAVDLVEKLVWHHDQPFGDSSAIPTYLLGELTRGHVTVALCGDGGDELFAGYERFAASLAVGAYNSIPRPLAHALPARSGAASRAEPCAAGSATCSASPPSPRAGCRTPTSTGSASSTSRRGARCSRTPTRGLGVISPACGAPPAPCNRWTACSI